MTLRQKLDEREDLFYEIFEDVEAVIKFYKENLSPDRSLEQMFEKIKKFFQRPETHDLLEGEIIVEETSCLFGIPNTDNTRTFFPKYMLFLRNPKIVEHGRYIVIKATNTEELKQLKIKFERCCEKAIGFLNEIKEYKKKFTWDCIKLFYFLTKKSVKRDFQLNENIIAKFIREKQVPCRFFSILPELEKSGALCFLKEHVYRVEKGT